MIGTFFTNLAKYNEEQALDFFVSNFLHNDKKWIGKSDGNDIYYLIESIKILLVIILGVSVILLGIIWGITNTFDELFSVVRGQRLLYQVTLMLLVMRLLAYLKQWDSLQDGIDRWRKGSMERL